MNDEEKMFEGLDEDLEEEPRRKSWWYIFGIVLVAIFLASYLTIAPVQHVIRGQLTSNSVQDSSLSLRDISILFMNDTDDILSLIYSTEQEGRSVETSVCLLGEKKDDTYFIDEIYYPQIISQFYNHVSFTACPQETLIMLHTHPYKQCIASDTDINTFENRKERNEDLLMLVMCEENRYAVYS